MLLFPWVLPGVVVSFLWLWIFDANYGVLGPQLTILGSDPATTPWLAAAEARGIPLRAVDLTALGFAPVAGEDLVLVRPDQHIAWRGDASTDPVAVLTTVLTAGLAAD
jgi:ABC-type sugar transport system permease subunit